jgi:C-terminal processing protease CtpA/Prc
LPPVNPTVAVQNPGENGNTQAAPKTGEEALPVVDQKEPDAASKVPALKKLKEAEKAYEKARQEVAKELDEALAKADTALAKAMKELADAKDKDARRKASKAVQTALHELHDLRIARFHVDVPRLGRTLPPSVPEESRLQAHLQTPSETLRSQLKLEKGQGLVVISVEKDGATAKAGIQANDIFLQLDGKPVPSDMKEFRKLLAEIKPDTAVTATVLRQGKQESIKELRLPEAGASPTRK